MSKKGIESLETFDLTKSYNGRMVVDRPRREAMR